MTTRRTENREAGLSLLTFPFREGRRLRRGRFLRFPQNWGLGGLLLALLTAPVHAQFPAVTAAPPDKPILRIETGMHTALIRRISVDAANRYLATASLDKTVRVWDAKTGALLNTLRPPIGDGYEGNMYAVALSPDGSMIACGGFTDSTGHTKSLYLFDRATGRLTRRLTGLPNVINHLAFSPEGRFLAAALGSGGIRLWRAADWTVTGQDTDYGDISYGVAFSPDSAHLAASCYDGFVRLYDISSDGSLHLSAKSRVAGGTQPYGVAFSPDGSKIAVGFDDAPRVAVVSAADLSPRVTPDAAGLDNEGFLSSVTWSADGQTLYAGGGCEKHYDDGWPFIVRRWADGGRGKAIDLPAAADSLTDLQPRSAGGVFFGAADPAFGAFDGADRRVLFQGPAIADFRANGDGFRLSRDGGTVLFAYQDFGKQPASFALAARALTLGPGNAALAAPVTTAAGLNVQGWEGAYSPTLNGQTLPLQQQYEMSRSLAVAPGGQSFLLGTDWQLYCFARDGAQKWSVAAPGVAWAVNVSRDGKLAVAAFGDGTIRWYRMTDGQELFALFLHADRKRWVAWTPSGQYDCSPGAEDLIGWHVNQGRDHEAKFYPVSRFFSQFYTPNLMARVIQGDALPAPSVNLAQGIKPPPSVEITSPTAGQAIDGGVVQVTVEATDQGGGVQDIRLFQNGTRISDDQKKIVEVPAGDAKTLTRTFTVTLVPGQNVLKALAANTDRTDSNPAEVTLELKAAPSSADLYILAAGIEAYKNPQFALPYCKSDAQAFASAIAQRGKPIFGSIHTTVLTDDQVTRSGLEAAFAQIKAQAKPTDAFVFYYSGHGYELENDAVSPDDFYIVCQDVLRLDGAEGIATKGLSAQRLKELATGVPALKKLLVLDACQSGGAISAFSKGLAEETAIAQLAHSTGTVVLAASLKEQSASVFDALKHSVFTYALLQGLAGEADPPPGDGKVTVKKLDTYLDDALPRLTKKYGGQTQYPESYAAGQDFPLGVH